MKVDMTIYVNENDPNEWKVFASDEFIKKNKDAEMKYAAEAAKANKQARLEETRRILQIYNSQRSSHQQSQPKQSQQNPQPSLLEQRPKQQSQQPPQQNNNTTTNASNNVLKHLQLMRRISGQE
jgi:hypothetical protein